MASSDKSKAEAEEKDKTKDKNKTITMCMACHTTLRFESEKILPEEQEKETEPEQSPEEQTSRERRKKEKKKVRKEQRWAITTREWPHGPSVQDHCILVSPQRESSQDRWAGPATLHTEFQRRL